MADDCSLWFIVKTIKDPQWFDALIKTLGPNAILINSNLQVCQVYGDVSHYVETSGDTDSTDLSFVLKSTFKQDVEFALQVAHRTNQKFVGVTRSNTINHSQKFKIVAYPLQIDPGGDMTTLIVFEEWTDEAALIVEQNDGSPAAIDALKVQVDALRAENDKLEINSQQLRETNQNLNGILDNITLPLIVVDRSLNITYSSSAAIALFQIDNEKALPHISNCQSPEGFPELIDCVQMAVANQSVISHPISNDKFHGSLQVVPHFSASDEVISATIVLNDNTQDVLNARDELQLIFDNLPEAILVIDKTGKIIKSNAATDRFFGLSKGESEGKNKYDFFHKNVRERIKKSDIDCLETGKPEIDKVEQIECVNQKEIWARVSRIPVLQPYQEDALLYIVINDITEEQKAIESLKQSERRLNVAMRVTSIGIWEREFEADEVFWSEGIRKLAGMEKDKTLFGFDEFKAHVHPDDWAKVELVRKNHIEKGDPYLVQYRFRNGDGDYVWVETAAQAEWDDKGSIVRFTGTVSDITKRRADIVDLHALNSQLNLASDMSGVGYWDVNLAEGTLFWSEQMYKIHGLSPEEYSPDAKTAVGFYHPDDLPKVEMLIANAIKSCTDFSFQARLKNKHEGYRIINAKGKPYRDESGRVTNIFGVFQDVTEAQLQQKQLKLTHDELARSNEELSRFSYVCSHDMKEPVRMIEMMSSLLTNPDFDVGDVKRNELLERIGSNTIRLRAIIDNLLAFSRIDAKVEVGSVNLSEVLNDIQQTMLPHFQAQNASVEFAQLPEIWGAKIHFTQLFQNLIGNSLKFNDKDRPIVRVAAQKTTSGWLISVEDNGPGVPKDARGKVFELFSRLKRRDEVEGTGLGLSIVQKIVAQYNGEIKCEESALGGAKFEFSISDTRLMNG